MNSDERNDLVLGCATDTSLFSKVFFSGTARQETPEFHHEMDALIDGPDRFINIQVFRGGAKTTKIRIATAKRIAYRLSNTVLYVSKSQGHAARNLMWLRRQVERNKLFADTFQLKPGAKWNDEELQILCGPDEVPVWVVGLGITGSARGVNIDDYRPDFIPVDDIMDEENSATPEQRNKMYKLVHGALKYSLAPRSENPWAKMLILQTPLDSGDISALALRDPEFVSVRYGCWTKETEDLPVEHRVSAWPQRWTTEELQAQRKAAITKNELSLFSREMECKLIAPEMAKFKTEWLQFYTSDEVPPLEEMKTVLIIDPVPPPSEREIAKNMAGKDYEALAVLGKHRGKIYVLEIVSNRGHDPSWTVAEFFRLASKWRVAKVKVETVAYQKTLVWLMRAAMKTRGQYFVVEDYKDRRSKQDRIIQGIKPVASNKMLYVKHDMQELISQYTAYDNVKHDDELEVVAIGCETLQDAIANEAMALDETQYERLDFRRGAP